MVLVDCTIVYYSEERRVIQEGEIIQYCKQLNKGEWKKKKKRRRRGRGRCQSHSSLPDPSSFVVVIVIITPA